jgi:hypothetical protein
MPKLSATAFPSYRLHKQSGQAIVALNGRDHCLGPFGSLASREKYNRLIAEWLASGKWLLKSWDELEAVSKPSRR